jgi:hypothetical protein
MTGRPLQRTGQPRWRCYFSPWLPRRPAPTLAVSGVEGSAGTVEGTWDKVAVDLMSDLDALMPEPPGYLGDGDALGEGNRGAQVAQRVRDELWRQPCFRGGALEVFLVTAAHDQFILAATPPAAARGPMLQASALAALWQSIRLASFVPIPRRVYRLVRGSHRHANVGYDETGMTPIHGADISHDAPLRMRLKLPSRSYARSGSGGKDPMSTNTPRYCRCGNRLAWNHAGALCGSCERQTVHHRAEPPTVSPAFLATPALRDALAAQHIGRVARAYRRHSEFAARCGRDGVSQELLGSWLGLTQAQVSGSRTVLPSATSTPSLTGRESCRSQPTCSGSSSRLAVALTSPGKSRSPRRPCRCQQRHPAACHLPTGWSMTRMPLP